MASKLELSRERRALLLIHAAVLFAFPLMEKWINPPARYPDVWVVLNCVIGASHFALLFGYYYFLLPTRKIKKV